ncbi:ead/Ea22-like family protein [Escherichia coli]|nr:ead/Ea22-like family protein [Escherichia coli]EFN5203429.1 ead/Ea22-like family protein [Escherichia coli]EGI2406670.1 ead/Ea22-like family protein [Escherichia coli]
MARMTIDYQALREKAEKATCGVWSLEYGEERFDAGDALIHREVVGYLPICRIEGAHPESGFDEDFQMEQQANAEFIAAANPATVLALLDELEAAEKRIAELESLTVPQLPQQAVPDEMPEPDTARMFFTDAVVAIAKVQGWNACRAAMLHSAEPVSQAYKLKPSGWL